MVAWAILFFGRWTPRQVAGMFIGIGVFLVGIAILLLLGSAGQSSDHLYVNTALAVLCLGAISMAFGIVWSRKPSRPQQFIA